jgi:SNF2 family DNA or RNA helicase
MIWTYLTLFVYIDGRGNTPKDYQLQGAEYLAKLAVDSEFKGGFLADEMGMGKTGISMLHFCLY